MVNFCSAAMTNTRTKYAVAVVAAALVASLALVATVGLTRSEANRGEPQGVPPSRATAIRTGGPRRCARWRPSSSSSGTYPPPLSFGTSFALSCVSSPCTRSAFSRKRKLAV